MLSEDHSVESNNNKKRGYEEQADHTNTIVSNSTDLHKQEEDRTLDEEFQEEDARIMSTSEQESLIDNFRKKRKLFVEEKKAFSLHTFEYDLIEDVMSHLEQAKDDEESKLLYQRLCNLQQQADEQDYEGKSSEEIKKLLCQEEVESIYLSNDQFEKCWHVLQAKIVLQSLKLRDPQHQKDPLSDLDWTMMEELTKTLGKPFPDKTIAVKIKEEQVNAILKEFISKREAIESTALYCADFLVKRCVVHDVEFISQLIDSTAKIHRTNLDVQACQIAENSMGFGDTQPELTNEVIDTWQTFILPQVVKTQQELNCLPEPHLTVSIERSDEKKKLDEKLLLNEYNEEEYAFYLDGFFMNSKESIKEEREQEKEFEDEEQFFYDDSDCNDFSVAHFSHLFNKLLPDEDMTYIPPFSQLLLKDAEDLFDNPYFSIIELTLRMYDKSVVTHEEHQDLPVSTMRLGVSLMILNCLNKEICIMKQRKSIEACQIMYRPLVRALLDTFIVDSYHSPVLCWNGKQRLANIRSIKEYDEEDLYEFQKDVFLQIRGLRPSLNDDDFTDSDEEDETETDESDCDMESSQAQELLSDPCSKSETFIKENDVEKREVNYEENSINPSQCHPIWEHEFNTQVSPKKHCLDTIMHHNPVPTSLTTSENWLCDVHAIAKDSFVKEPVYDQEWVTLYFPQVRRFYNEDNILSADHVNERHPYLDIEYQDPSQSHSFHIDLLRIMRRGSMKSCTEGVAIEAFFSLKNFISSVFQKLHLLKKTDGDRTVTAQDVEKVIGKDLVNVIGLRHAQHDDEQIYEAPRTVSFKTQPVEPPEKFSDIVYENEDNLLTTKGDDTPLRFSSSSTSSPHHVYSSSEKFDSVRVGTPPAVSLYHDLINNGTMANDLTLLFQSGKFTDSFIESSEGVKIGVYTPILKVRCPSLYEQFFNSPEKRELGLHAAKLISSTDFKIDENVEQATEIQELSSIMDSKVCTAWIENVYLGVFENMFDESSDASRFKTLETINMKYPIVAKNVNSDTWLEWETSTDNMLQDPNHYINHDMEYLLDRHDDYEKCLTLNALYNDNESKDFSLQICHNNFEPSIPLVQCRAHKYILACRSSFFRVLFEGNFGDEQSISYDASEIFRDVKALEMFVFYLYHNFLSDRYESTFSQLIELYQAADFFDVNGLKDLVQFQLGVNVQSSSLEECVDLLQFSLENDMKELFITVNNLLLSTYDSDGFTIMDDITTEYYKTLSGSIDLENVIVKLEFVYRVLNSDNSLHMFYREMLDSFHRTQLIWFIIRNLVSFNTVDGLECLKTIKETRDPNSRNLFQVVHDLAERYGYEF
ncbi:hypothetical protein C9374_004087 [Naegleria lovaniensis]|uniref:BTB domain-containing protein n=1 Tax=Naegleria lovaniensis TaxID=51637 RepID=A0AA88GLU8_NAELO|nr:uncharacterized protein C9374_004087 [Naegleria lovaniensis]KAG2383416.1 hypothetical protein C9374_004087 [Naegleria lovaniensis]